MDFRVVTVVVLAMIALRTQQVSCQVILTGTFDPQDSVIEGTLIILKCTVEDRNSGLGATNISGSQAIFDCPSVSSSENNIIFLRHSHMQSATAICGELVSGRIVEVQNGTRFLYIAQINITTTIAMNGGYVECSEHGKNDSKKIQLPNIIALLGLLAVEFPSNDTFVIHWNQANEGAQISHYFTSVIGEDCGNCNNLGIVSNVTNQLSCTGWEPNGQVCNVTVAAIAFGQHLSSSRLVYLQIPKALHFDLIPVYSYDLEELKSVKIMLAVDSTVDPNDVPITFIVNVERSILDNMILKCSFKVPANSKCRFSNALVKYHCEIDFTVSSCLELLLQQGQEADYHIGIFAKNSIGNSSQTTTRILSYAHLRVQRLFTEPQQSQEEYNFISISFSQVYATVTSMIEYGPNCQALNNQSIVGYNVTTLTFSVSIINECFISVTINNTFQSLMIQGNFSNDTSTSGDCYIIGIIVLVLILMGSLLANIILCCLLRKKSISVEFPGEEPPLQ